MLKKRTKRSACICSDLFFIQKILTLNNVEKEKNSNSKTLTDG